MPLAARITDMHVCPMVTGLVPHVGGPIVTPGDPLVFIGFMPAATVGSVCFCVGPPDTVIKGSSTVIIGGKPAARMGDNTAHGGVIVTGCPTVLIGDGGGGGGSGDGPSGGGGSTPDAPLPPFDLFNNLKNAIKGLTQPSRTDPDELPLLSWERLKGSLDFFSKELGEPGEKGLELGIEYAVKEGSLLEGIKQGGTTIFGIPVRGSVEGQLGTGELGLGAGLSKDGISAGGYGELSAATGEAVGVIGTKNLGITGDLGGKALSGEVFVGIKDNQFGAKIGGTLISAEGAVGVNVAGVNVGLKGEIGLKAELGFEFGAKGVEVKLPFISLGIDFGSAK